MSKESPITKLGFKEVDEAFHKAKEHLIYAETQLVKAQEQVAKMEKCSKCPHVNVENRDGYIHQEAQCTDCGFTWID